MPHPGHDDVVDPRVGFLAPLAWEDSDRRPARRLGAPSRSGHDLAEPAGHDRAAALREQPPDLLGTPLVLAPAADHRDLNRRHRAIVEPW